MQIVTAEIRSTIQTYNSYMHPPIENWTQKMASEVKLL